ncbi:hypothetical protein QA640_05765 [Bradyrhizobium sp. CB82]|nr:hypothetical protein [Bradyrhizobium sp. CB82]WFU42002.1 hypothetical protein QA640_05765 [Bradyrhizobium sp. CB82]
MPKTSHAAGLHRASLKKLHDLDAALELMYYGWRGMTLQADAYLAKQGLSRPHHRGRVGVAYWPVLKGPMLRIFVIDAALFAANLGVALLLASHS